MNTLLASLVLTSTALVTPVVGEVTPDVEVNVTPVECGVERETPPGDLLLSMFMANGLEAFIYDNNHDKKPDFEVLIPQGDENRYPLFYRVDRDYDGFIDITYIDDRRDGSCNGIRVYWTPKMDKPSNRHQGTPIPEGGQCDESHHGDKGKEA